MRRRKWTKNDLEKAVEKSFSIRNVIKMLGLIPAGGNYSQVHKYIKEFGLDTSHFRGMGWNKGMKFPDTPKTPLKDMLVRNSHFQSYKLKNRLFKEGRLAQKCVKCGWAKISPDGRLPLELDHINGDSRDNRFKNLRILCPNCHSLTPTYRRKGKKK
jgi:hypothetical protein